MAPEYALWGHLTYKADVYSFGIVLLEIVSGQSNSNYMPIESCVCLLDWVLFSSLLFSLMKPSLHIFAAFPSRIEHPPPHHHHHMPCTLSQSLEFSTMLIKLYISGLFIAAKWESGAVYRPEIEFSFQQRRGRRGGESSTLVHQCNSYTEAYNVRSSGYA